MSDFKTGDVVELKSRGPAMTVEFIEDVDGVNLVTCSWFEGEKYNKKSFSAESLQKPKPPSKPTLG